MRLAKTKWIFSTKRLNIRKVISIIVTHKLGTSKMCLRVCGWYYECKLLSECDSFFFFSFFFSSAVIYLIYVTLLMRTISEKMLSDTHLLANGTRKNALHSLDSHFIVIAVFSSPHRQNVAHSK